MFTAFADTAIYLYENLVKWATDVLGINAALVCGGGDLRTTFGNKTFNEILTNFSPSKQRSKIRPCPRAEKSISDCDRLHL